MILPTFYNIEHQSWVLVGMKVNHITNRSISQSRAEHRDVVLKHISIHPLAPTRCGYNLTFVNFQTHLRYQTTSTEFFSTSSEIALTGMPHDIIDWWGDNISFQLSDWCCKVDQILWCHINSYGLVLLEYSGPSMRWAEFVLIQVMAQC